MRRYMLPLHNCYLLVVREFISSQSGAFRDWIIWRSLVFAYQQKRSEIRCTPPAMGARDWTIMTPMTKNGCRQSTRNRNGLLVWWAYMSSHGQRAQHSQLTAHFSLYYAGQKWIQTFLPLMFWTDLWAARTTKTTTDNDEQTHHGRFLIVSDNTITSWWANIEVFNQFVRNWQGLLKKKSAHKSD